MKIYSTQHFENMKIMCKYFGAKSEYGDLYSIEFETSKNINSIIEKEEDSNVGNEKILSLLAEVEEHFGNVQWLDYKIHVMATLRVNGFQPKK